MSSNARPWLWLLVVLALAPFQARAASFSLLLESDISTPAPDEIYLATFNTFADLLSQSLSSGAYSQLGIVSDFSVGGLAYDGAYHLLLESDSDASAPVEVYVATFNTLADLLNGSLSSGVFSQIEIASGYSVKGFTANSLPVIEPPTVPLPASAFLLLGGLAAIAATRRRSRPSPF